MRYNRAMPSLHTTAVHAGHISPLPGQPSAPPIVTATAWSYPDMESLDAALGSAEAGYAYSRQGAPTQEAFEAAVQALEGAAGAAAFGSGMAALHAALICALDPGPVAAALGAPPPARKLVAATELYGTTRTLVNHLAVQAGVSVHWVDIRNLDAVTAALQSEPAGGALLFEIVSNPLCRVADARALLEQASAAGVRSVVDSTFTTPYLIQPLALGADYVVHSATKYLAGHGDVLGGVAATARAEAASALRQTRNLLGSNLSPFDAYLALRGLRTLPLRVREQNRNALALAQWLAAHPRVAQVYYPGLPEDPDHALASALFRPGCFGAMLAFELAQGDRDQVFAVLERLHLIQRLATLGDVVTLASYPAHASHRALTPQQRAALGISDGCIRLSVGIEDADDLIGDLAQALTG
jgi:cystathionine gamma-synthase/methionine-gamma-lyase